MKKKARNATTKKKVVARMKEKSKPSHNERPKRKRETTCECGRAKLDPQSTRLEMCETCVVCSEMMHTVSDKKKHELAHAPEVEPIEDGNEPDAKKPSKSVRSVHRDFDVEAGREVQRFIEDCSTTNMAPRWRFFFSCQRYPVLRSQLVTTIMAGTRLEVERISKHALLDVVLLATACREFHNAEIVDDYPRLLERTEEEWRQPDWTCKVFSSIHDDWANAIINHNATDFYPHETRYIPALAGWLLDHEPPSYFNRELTDDTPAVIAAPKTKTAKKGARRCGLS